MIKRYLIMVIILIILFRNTCLQSITGAVNMKIYYLNIFLHKTKNLFIQTKHDIKRKASVSFSKFT